MKVAIDTYPLKSGHKFRGIGQNTQNLISSLSTYHPEITILIDNAQAADIIHYTYFDLFFHTLPIRKPKPSIVTIHDVIPLLYPKEFPVGLRGKVNFFLQRLALKNVKAFITVSEHSRHDAIRYLHIQENLIHVRYLAPQSKFRELTPQETAGVKEKLQLPDKFILYVGDINYNKNVPGLIRAFNQIQSNADLVLVGKAFESKGIKEIDAIHQAIAEGSKREKIHILGFVSDNDIVALYNLATVYVQPSFYEGFGYPVIEAFACGTPVISSDRASLKEIIGEAAYIINPDDLQNMASSIDTVLANQQLQQKLATLGVEQVKQFNQKTYADKTAKVYKDVFETYCK